MGVGLSLSRGSAKRTDAEFTKIGCLRLTSVVDEVHLRTLGGIHGHRHLRQAMKWIELVSHRAAAVVREVGAARERIIDKVQDEIRRGCRGAVVDFDQAADCIVTVFIQGIRVAGVGQLAGIVEAVSDPELSATELL